MDAEPPCKRDGSQVSLKLSVRTKLFLVLVALIVASMGAADAYLTSSVSVHLTDTIRADLSVRARLVARAAATFSGSPDDDAAPWARLAQELGQFADARVTIVARSGTVLGDSQFALAELPELENFAARPEVVAERPEVLAERPEAWRSTSEAWRSVLRR